MSGGTSASMRRAGAHTGDRPPTPGTISDGGAVRSRRTSTPPTVLLAGGNLANQTELAAHLMSAHVMVQGLLARSAVVKTASVLHTDVVILDIDGLSPADRSLIRTLRQTTQTSVIVIAARRDSTTLVDAFECGADDYLALPFAHAELVARIRVALRRRETWNSPRALAPRRRT